ncbi:ABC transporter ATP-binding protein [Enterococcus hulanensis]|uniref:ABC transporter ATP-binding protein n=1 Tax=Enterococcus hulanensis TaxID=2559929 RepID=UPI00288CC072|nr:ABC transporter ATP-binding protein [Enterococcus hulanensis]MDT2659111.1 ABC transporter ATP-binding protein [Enterococcus hulanensis]
MLKIENLTKQYKNKIALDNLTVEFPKGVTGLLGPNGAGKSTLMRILSTVDTPSKGSVTFNGNDITKHPNDLRRVLGYLPQDFGVYPNMSASEFLEYMAAMKGLSMKSAKVRINELLDILNLTSAGKRHLGGFSGGMKQRVGIAQALLNDPKILIVDEPTVGLDPDERIRFRNLLASLAADRTIILSTHIVSDIESIAPNLVVMKEGRLIAAASPEKLMTQAHGKVWNAIVDVNELEALQQKYIVSNSMQRSDGIHVRIVSTEQPRLGADLVEPSLEDAYLYATKGK